MICMWNILNGKMPNPGIRFRPRSRLGIQAIVPSLNISEGIACQTRFDETFAVTGPTLWNCLPSSITTIESAQKFKNHLTKLFCELEDMPPVPGYTRANNNTLPEVLRRAEERWSLL